MSLTINGATNTITAASGLTVAGNTAVSGTLSASASGVTNPVKLSQLSNATQYGALLFGTGTTDANGMGLYGLQTDNLYYNVPTGAKHVFRVNGVGVYETSSTGLAVTGTLSTGTGTGATAGLKVVNGTSGVGSGYGAIYAENIAPSASNYYLAGFYDGNGLALNSGTNLYLQIGGATVAQATSSGLAVTGALSSTGNINNAQYVTVSNSDAGIGAQSAFRSSNGTSLAYMGILGTGYTTAGVFATGRAFTFTDSPAGYAYITSNQPQYWSVDTGTTAAMTLSSTALTLGTGVNLVTPDGDITAGSLAKGTGTTINVLTSASVRPSVVFNNNSQTWGTQLKSDAGQNWYMIANNTETVGVYMTPSASGWNNLSDERAKKDWVELTDALSKIATLRAGTFTWVKDETLPRDVGVIAQDVLGVLPEAVTTSDPEAYGVRYTHLVPLLIKAIQELTTRVAALEAA